MFAELAVIIIVLTLIIFQYLKSTLIKSVIMFVAAVVGLMVSFGFFEILGNLIIGYGFIASFIMPICMLLLFLFPFAIIYTIGEKLLLNEIYFQDIIDRIGRSIFGALTGFIIAGVIVSSVAMTPLGSKWPYARYSSEDISYDLEKNKTLILNADGFTAGLFSKLSSGAFSSKNSFAAIHPEFTNEIHLNRLNSNDNTSNLIIAGKNSIKVNSALLVDKELKSSDPENPIPTSASKGKAVIVNVTISGKALTDGGALSEDGKLNFTPTQLKLLCREKGESNDLLGKSQVAYPIGFLKSEGVVELKEPAELLSYRRSEFKGSKLTLDLVFYIPSSTVPTGLQFKLNTITKVPTLKTAEDVAEKLLNDEQTKEKI